MENKKSVCWCCMVVGILVIVFAWLKVAFAPIVLTVLGALVIIMGLMGKCCCTKKESQEGQKSCCS